MRALATSFLLFIGISVQSAEPPKSPLSPEESLKHFVLGDPNLLIEVVAAEPEVIDPVAIQFDEHGRLWVVEMRDYPTGPKEAPPPLGGPDAKPLSRIKLLEDKDGDGRYETAHVFADNLLFATGVQPWDGGVIVTLAGEVAYFKDTDGDHKADVRETWFTGFAQANTQLRANHPTFGPDGWIYVANGLRGGNVIAVKKDWPVKTEGLGKDKTPSPSHPVTLSPAQPTGQSHDPQNPVPVSLTGRDFKFDPLTGRYEAISGNGQFGLTFDAWGNRFVCDNRHPCRHVIFEEDFIRRCPHVAFPAVVHDVIPPDDKNQVFPLTSAWTTSNLHAGTFTASCGVTVYTGDWLPEEFRGNVFVCEPTGNLVQRAILEPDGVTFKSRNPYQRSPVAPRQEKRNAPTTSANKSTPNGQSESNARSADLSRSDRATETQEFLASRDDWFRPVDLQNGPDGALYVVDMYRAVIEHPEWVPDELKKRPDTWLGNDKGRIYRIRSAKQDRRDLELDLLRSKPFVFLNDDGIDREDNPQLAGWYRPTASRILHERLIRQNPDEAFTELLWRCTGQSSGDKSPRVLWRPELSSTMWQSPNLFQLLDSFASDNAIGYAKQYDDLDRLMLLILKRLTAEALNESSDDASRGRATAIAIQTLYSGLKTHLEDERLYFQSAPRFHLQAIQTWHALAPSPSARTALLGRLAVSQSKFTGWDNFNLKDPWVRQAMIASEGDRPAEFLAELIHVGTHRVGAGGMRGGAFDIEPRMWEPSAELLSAVGEQVGRNGKPDDVSSSVIKLCQAPEPSVHSFQIVASGLLGIAKGVTRRRDQWNGPLDKFSAECAETLAGFAERTMSEVGRIDEDNPHWSQPRRQIAIQLLPHLNDKKAFEYLKQLVESETDQTLRMTALESFASLRRPEVDAWLIERYRSETPAIRRAILAALFASKERQLRLLEAIEQGQIAATELGPVQVNQLTQAKDETLRERAKTVLAAAAPASRHEVLDAYRPALALTADPKRGREVFVKNCSTCHRVDNVGVNVAPDISDTRTKKPEQLLMDILDPNKAIDANYFAYAVVTKEGKTESGVISSETATSITLKQPEGKVLTLLRTDIDELRNTGLSLMPVGVEKNIDQQAMADLIFWLKNWRYLDGKVPATSLGGK